MIELLTQMRELINSSQLGPHAMHVVERAISYLEVSSISPEMRSLYLEAENNYRDRMANEWLDAIWALDARKQRARQYVTAEHSPWPSYGELHPDSVRESNWMGLRHLFNFMSARGQ